MCIGLLQRRIINRIFFLFLFSSFHHFTILQRSLFLFLTKAQTPARRGGQFLPTALLVSPSIVLEALSALDTSATRKERREDREQIEEKEKARKKLVEKGEGIRKGESGKTAAEIKKKERNLRTRGCARFNVWRFSIPFLLFLPLFRPLFRPRGREREEWREGEW